MPGTCIFLSIPLEHIGNWWEMPNIGANSISSPKHPCPIVQKRSAANVLQCNVIAVASWIVFALRATAGAQITRLKLRETSQTRLRSSDTRCLWAWRIIFIFSWYCPVKASRNSKTVFCTKLRTLPRNLQYFESKVSQTKQTLRVDTSAAVCHTTSSRPSRLRAIAASCSPEGDRVSPI